ncbi:methyltransferase domain-containing protein [Gemmatimonadota bacterium]
MTDIRDFIQLGLDSYPLREPLIREVIKALDLPDGSHGLDVASGLGQPARSLAEAIGSTGHVTGIDLSPAFVQYAEDMARESGLSDRLTFSEGNANRLPFDDDSFDWIWSCDFAGYPVGDLLPLLQEFSRVVKPGGTVAILAWTSQNLLPGYPLLEARLNATSSGYHPYITGARPETHFTRSLGPFREAGFEDAEARSFTGDVQAPLSDEIQTAVIAFFDMLWGAPQPGESPEDRAAYERLCTPKSPDFILDHSDYHAFFTYLMFQGTVPD